MSDEASFIEVKQRILEYYLQGSIYFDEHTANIEACRNCYLKYFRQDIITYFRKHQSFMPLLLKDWFLSVPREEFYQVIRECGLDGRFFVTRFSTQTGKCHNCRDVDEKLVFLFDNSDNCELYQITHNTNLYCDCERPIYFILFNKLNSSAAIIPGFN